MADSTIPEDKENDDPVAALRDTLDQAKTSLANASANEDALLGSISGDNPVQDPGTSLPAVPIDPQAVVNQPNPQVTQVVDPQETDEDTV